jgi:hypothetical protein
MIAEADVDIVRIKNGSTLSPAYCSCVADLCVDSLRRNVRVQEKLGEDESWARGQSSEKADSRWQFNVMVATSCKIAVSFLPFPK